jgi:hypothetical protein
VPVVPFDALPDDARVWVFASESPLKGGSAHRLLDEVDRYLEQWRAHGQPLTCARTWRDDRFLAVGVDQTDAYASGCSIDGLFRVLQALRPVLGASLLGGGRVHYRDERGAIQSASREEFANLGARGGVTAETRVFDPTVATVAEWRQRFETDAGQSWHGALLG